MGDAAAAVGVETSQARLQLPPRAAPSKAKPLLHRLYNWPPAAASLRAVLLAAPVLLWLAGSSLYTRPHPLHGRRPTLPRASLSPKISKWTNSLTCH